ncbi:MAG: hypothetical protein CMA64_06630 [Euryarchaeota archaeon]|nr:hypothetical protein [Euryarchaeota archaeon]
MLIQGAYKLGGRGLKILLWWLAFFTIFFLVSGCQEESNEVPVPTGKGKIHGKLNERKIPCRLVAVEKSKDLKGAYQCVYDHPKSDVHDVVTVGQSNMCPNMVYCDRR